MLADSLFVHQLKIELLSEQLFYYTIYSSVWFYLFWQEAAKDETSKQPPTALHKQLDILVKQLTDLMLEEKLGTELVGSLTDPQGAQLKWVLK